MNTGDKLQLKVLLKKYRNDEDMTFDEYTEMLNLLIDYYDTHSTHDDNR